MGYEYYIINETRKQVFGGFKSTLQNDEWEFECNGIVTQYLTICKGDSIRLVGEENPIVEETLHYHFSLKKAYEYKYIPLDKKIFEVLEQSH